MIESLLGKWDADLDRWGQEADTLVSMGMAYLLSNLEVEFTTDTLFIRDYGKKSTTFSYTVGEQSSDSITLLVERQRGGGSGIYEATLTAPDRLELVLTEPKHDFMALKRVAE